MKSIMSSTLVSLVVFLAVLGGWFYLLQPAMIFLPGRQLSATPADWGLDYEDVWLSTRDDVQLHGWYLPRPGARRALLFFHGNAGNISHRRASIEIFHRLGLNVLIVDYRGYGRSAGRPSEEGLYLDAQAAWDYLVGSKGTAPGDVIVFGRSLGGAVAAWLAAEERPGALILESTFNSARDFVAQAFPMLSWLIVRRYEFDTAARLTAIRCPVLVLHSPQDEIMPYALGERLYQAARAPKRFQELRGDHNGGFMLSQPGYERGLAAFLAELPSMR